MLPTYYGAPNGDVLRGKPIHLVTSGLHSILMLMVDSLILSLGFHSQDNYSLRDRKEYRSFLSMIDPTVTAL